MSSLWLQFWSWQKEGWPDTQVEFPVLLSDLWQMHFRIFGDSTFLGLSFFLCLIGKREGLEVERTMKGVFYSMCSRYFNWSRYLCFLRMMSWWERQWDAVAADPQVGYRSVGWSPILFLRAMAATSQRVSQKWFRTSAVSLKINFKYVYLLVHVCVFMHVYVGTHNTQYTRGSE